MAALYLMGSGGAVFSYEDPLPEHIRKQWEKGDLTQVDEDGTPYEEQPWEADEDDEGEEPARRPNTSSSKAEWVAYAVSQGMPEDEAEAMTRAALIEQFHSKEQ